MDVAGEMKWMMKQDVSLRSAQGKALAAIQRGDRKIVIMMPTGASKSVLFMLPTAVRVRGVTIVIVLFVTLRHNMRAKGMKAGVLVGK